MVIHDSQRLRCIFVKSKKKPHILSNSHDSIYCIGNIYQGSSYYLSSFLSYASWVCDSHIFFYLFLFSLSISSLTPYALIFSVIIAIHFLFNLPHPRFLCNFILLIFLTVLSLFLHSTCPNNLYLFSLIFSAVLVVLKLSL